MFILKKEETSMPRILRITIFYISTNKAALPDYLRNLAHESRNVTKLLIMVMKTARRPPPRYLAY